MQTTIPLLPLCIFRYYYPRKIYILPPATAITYQQIVIVKNTDITTLIYQPNITYYPCLSYYFFLICNCKCMLLLQLLNVIINACLKKTHYNLLTSKLQNWLTLPFCLAENLLKMRKVTWIEYHILLLHYYYYYHHLFDYSLRDSQQLLSRLSSVLLLLYSVSICKPSSYVKRRPSFFHFPESRLKQ